METEVWVGGLSGAEVRPEDGPQGGAERSGHIVIFTSRGVRLGLDPYLQTCMEQYSHNSS